VTGPRRDLFGHPVHEKGVRTAGDSYFTPPALARVLVGLLPLEPGDVVLEPSAGGGAFCVALEARGCAVHALDVDPRAPALHMARPWRTQVGDFLTADVGRPQWVVGNPPYAVPGDPVTCKKCKGIPVEGTGACSKCKGVGYTRPMVPMAENHARRALQVAERGVAMLLRLALLAGQKRTLLWRSHPPAIVYVLPQRPSFTGGGTDQYDYMWCVWDNQHQGEPLIRWAPPYR
jgi:hypothetical protein